ncbi:MAG: ABC transporter substrate-binding protein [Clostridia bacterium]|nr:ABC transporter substrate-binding protein [Clostridia bacterium]
MKHKNLWAISLLIALLFSLAGCSSSDKNDGGPEQDPQKRCAVSDALTYKDSMDLTYAEEFAVDYFNEGGCLITVSDDRRYLVDRGDVPEAALKDLPEDVTVLKAPIADVYLAASASMDYFDSCGAIDSIRFSSLKASAWDIEDAGLSMEDGSILYAGKYSTPDYELLKSEGCKLAVENTMIYHTPEIIKTIESLGIPVFIDLASREGTPQGRMEWIKVYGLLTGKEKAAQKAFRAQEKEFLALEDAEAEASDDASPTVAYFSLRANETVSVRRANDYITSMIELAGGTYVFADLGKDDDSARATQVISMEEFYTTAKTADILIYNSTIGGEQTSLKKLLADAPVLKDCKAVKNGNVWCTTADLYQHSMGQGTFVRDLHNVFAGNDEKLTYLFKLQ